MGRYSRDDFRPQAHEQALRAIIEELSALDEVDARSLTKAVHRHSKGRGRVFSKAELIRGARCFAARYGWDAEAFARKLRMKPVRTHSGVAPVTLLTEPHPCSGRCLFCPNDGGVPKSYLRREPSVQRALQHGFDPYRQIQGRLEAFVANGHLVDKVELIVQGGSFVQYPPGYRRWFLTRCFEALNDFVPEHLRPEEPVARASEASPEVAGAPRAEPDVRAAQQANEKAHCRSVGLSVETRPDDLDEAGLVELRRLGVTKVQIGIQSLDEQVLRQNRRDHDLAATARAIKLLRLGGFKIQAHWMANLHGSDPRRDVADFARLFALPEHRPDELKLYPCSLLEGTGLMALYLAGEWRPYTAEELLEVLCACVSAVPEYCRLSRVMRDIPAEYIKSGVKLSNFRERIDAELARRGRRSRDIRAREIRRQAVSPAQLELQEVGYETSAGQERFLQLVTPADRIAGFLRLTLPQSPGYIAELEGRAIIRELHVYGSVAAIDAGGAGRQGANAQHQGLGRRLIERASEIARRAGYEHLAVISAVGTRPYYRRRGFSDAPLYQHRPLGPGGQPPGGAG